MCSILLLCFFMLFIEALVTIVDKLIHSRSSYLSISASQHVFCVHSLYSASTEGLSDKTKTISCQVGILCTQPAHVTPLCHSVHCLISSFSGLPKERTACFLQLQRNNACCPGDNGWCLWALFVRNSTHFGFQIVAYIHVWVITQNIQQFQVGLNNFALDNKSIKFSLLFQIFCLTYVEILASPSCWLES